MLFTEGLVELSHGKVGVEVSHSGDMRFDEEAAAVRAGRRNRRPLGGKNGARNGSDAAREKTPTPLPDAVKVAESMNAERNSVSVGTPDEEADGTSLVVSRGTTDGRQVVSSHQQRKPCCVLDG